MVNNLLTDPLYLDTAGSGIGRSMVHIIKSVEWINPESVGDRAYLLDAEGSVVCDFTCTIAKEGKRSDFGDLGKPFRGPFLLSILDSGALLVGKV